MANCAKILCVARDPIIPRFTRVGGGVTTFARACPVSLSRKPLSPGIKDTPKTDLALSRSLVHRQTWRLTGGYFRGDNTVPCFFLAVHCADMKRRSRVTHRPGT